MKTKTFLFAFLFIHCIVIAGERKTRALPLEGSFCVSNTVGNGAMANLSGNLRYDLLFVSESDSSAQQSTVLLQTSANEIKRKSPLFAGAMSALVPGSGEFYAERYTKSAIFFAVEIAALTTYFIYNNKGNNETNDFQNYANAHWSAVRYAEWIETYGVSDYGPELKAPFDFTKIANHDFSQINAWESGEHQSVSNPTISGFSHQLPQYGVQQYYELIGKYEQFKYGWDTYPKDNMGFPESDGGNYNSMVPQQMLNYAAERGQANRFYYTATTALTIAVVNHVLSALDAIWSTANYNKALTAELRMELQNEGLAQRDIMTELSVKIHL